MRNFRFALSLVLGSLLSGSVEAIGLRGIVSGPGGFIFVKVDFMTGNLTPLYSVSNASYQNVTALAYHNGARKYVATVFINSNLTGLITLDPITNVIGFPVTGIPTSYFEGLVWSPVLGGLVVSYGNNNFTNSLALLGPNFELLSSNFIATGLDMDTLFTSGTGYALNKLDTNNSWAGFYRHIISNPFGSPSLQPVGTNFWQTTDYDATWYPGLNRIYVTRGTSLAYVNATNDGMVHVGNFPLQNYPSNWTMRGLAFGPDPRTVSGTVNLQDTVGTFPSTPRQISWKLRQGNVVIYSGNLNMTSASAPLQFQMTDDFNGNFTIEFDGSSFLKKTVAFSMSGATGNFGTVTLQNGDPDFSGEVDAADIDLVIARFGNTYPSPSQDPDSDVDCSGEVDAADIDIVINNFGGVDS